MAVQLELFTSENCPFCPKAKEAVNKALEELGDEVEYSHYDINTDKGKVEEYGIMSVPTIVVNGRVAFREAPEPKRLISKLKRNMR